jgi:cell wall-associated NlpC family hydrolase
MGLTIGVLAPAAQKELPVQATSISQVQQNIKDTQQQLENITGKIDALTDEQSLIEEQIDDLNAEIINTMTSIGMKEDEIAAKETELVDKQAQIDVTQQAYEDAKAREEQQYVDMIGRIRRMYENGSNTYLNLFLAGGGLGGMLNRMDLVEHIYEYDRDKLTEYEETKVQVHDLWDQLEIEKNQLQTDKTNLEADREKLQSQKTSLDSMLAKKKKESSNFDAEIKKAKQEAAVAKKLLQQEQKKLAQLQAAQKKPSGSANNGNYTSTSHTSTIDNASGSEAGKNVAKYACQFIGNPYVYGGTSLTNGADCSGFTMRIFEHFGIDTGRSSRDQAAKAKTISINDIQPGDLLFYASGDYINHVALYIGGGQIIHASNSKTGIIISTAYYRTPYKAATFLN